MRMKIFLIHQLYQARMWIQWSLVEHDGVDQIQSQAQRVPPFLRASPLSLLRVERAIRGALAKEVEVDIA